MYFKGKQSYRLTAFRKDILLEYDQKSLSERKRIDAP
ncbi:hypothetical protein LSS_09713 [Leptospira santarosai serovar Shermani str. LT 821]|uniref:Uncharacterized protein n=1 Tax=Leptospira santarosai serovar Shermani str. LT 821 TaxID=758847 RepID=K8YBE0_9LEPT|nr:hypothetical protein LSS_09713 [Leptospira santarosai serovar Shermani str. LT 821]